MAEYKENMSDISSDTGVCRKVVNEAKQSLIELWNTSDRERKEAAIVIGFSGKEVAASGIITGGKEEVSYDKEIELAESMEKRMNLCGIHTHPTNTEFYNRLLSHSDLNVHLQKSDEIGNYHSSLALTQDRNTGKHVLFGIENDAGATGFRDVQKEVNSYANELMKSNDQKRRIELLNKMYHEMEAIGRFCEVEFDM